jgi:hypothetical protein
MINLDFGRICRSLVAPHNCNPYRFASSTVKINNFKCPRTNRSTNRIISAWPSFVTIYVVF